MKTNESSSSSISSSSSNNRSSSSSSSSSISNNISSIFFWRSESAPKLCTKAIRKCASTRGKKKAGSRAERVLEMLGMGVPTPARNRVKMPEEGAPNEPPKS